MIKLVYDIKQRENIWKTTGKHWLCNLCYNCTCSSLASNMNIPRLMIRLFEDERLSYGIQNGQYNTKKCYLEDRKIFQKIQNYLS